MRAAAVAAVCLAGVLLASADQETLRMVHAVFRHGERTPQDTYPNDPYINYSFEPVGWGQLTNVGKRKQYEQGRFLRERYGSFLGDYYNESVFILQSTDVDRTKMSAQLESAGLWPPVGWQKWNPELNWQPVPLIYQPLDEDTLLLVRTPCPGYHQERQRVFNLSEVQDYLDSQNTTQLYSYLQDHTGMKFADTDDIQSLYYTLRTEVEFNLTLPEWTKNVYPDHLLNLTVFSYIVNVYNKKLQRIKGGPLLKKIIDDSTGKINGTQRQRAAKMFMYSGHDATVVNLMRTVGVWDTQMPVYNVLALFELHQNSTCSGYSMRVYLRNTTEVEPYLLSVPGCGTDCPLDTFVQLMRDVLPTDMAEHCKVDDPNFQEPDAPPP